MGLISDLLLLPVTGPVRAMRVILEQVQAAADAEMMDEGRVQAELVALYRRLDLGEISEDEYEAQEAVLLDQLEEIRAYRELMEEDAYLDEDAYVDEGMLPLDIEGDEW